jgi:transposase
LHRELEELQDERTQHTNRIKGLLASHGVALAEVDANLPHGLEAARLWDGTPLPAAWQRRLRREHERWQFVDRQIQELEKERRQRIRDDATPHVEQVRRLLELVGIGPKGAWLLVFELFAWRHFANRKQVGGCAGLTPTPYDSGASTREQGISKAGKRRLRKMLVELAWFWLRWQPHSALSRWYDRRFGQGNRRARKVGIIALARKLLPALWKYLEHAEVPAGARLTDWEHQVGRRRRPLAA